MRALILLLFASPALATSVEEDVAAAVESLVDLSRRDESIASRVACYTGVNEPGRLHVRPCVDADADRISAVSSELKEAFPSDVSWVLDWLRQYEDGTTRVQVKLRSDEPTGLIEMRFVGAEMLLADVGTERLTPPAPPRPANDRERVERAMLTLFTEHDMGVAARLIVCTDPDGSRRTCNIEDPTELEHVLDIYDKVRPFYERLGPTGWAFTGYRKAISAEGTWHLLEISFERHEKQQKATAAFIDAGGTLALGDLIDWPVR